VALLQMIGPLWEIKVDQRLEARLNVDAYATSFCGPKQDANAAHAQPGRATFFALY
jgi:hypothetical protein